MKKMAVVRWTWVIGVPMLAAASAWAAAPEDPREKAAREAVNGRAVDEPTVNVSPDAASILRMRGPYRGGGVSVVGPEPELALENRRYFDALQRQQDYEAQLSAERRQWQAARQQALIERQRAEQQLEEQAIPRHHIRRPAPHFSRGR